MQPGASAEAVVRIPWAPVKDASSFADECPKLWLSRTVQYWRSIMAEATGIQVPCQKTTHAYLTANVYQLINADRGELHPGEGFYDHFYIRDGAYFVLQLEEAGLMDAARRAMASFLSHQRSDGRFSSTRIQFDANGQAPWALWQFYKITGDRSFLEKAYPPMQRAAEWLMQARRQAATDSPFAGLLPDAPNADGEGLRGMYHTVGYDFWNLRGLLCTADAARLLGKTDEADKLLREAKLYRAAIDTAWKRSGLAYFPPSWEKKGCHWGNTETLWPTELFAPDDPRVAATITQVREHFGGGGFVEGVAHRFNCSLFYPDADRLHPYMSAFTTMASLVRGEHEKVVEDFYWYLLHSTATHGFAEAVIYKRRLGGNVIPHGEGASNYANMLRHMLIHEHADELHLLRAVPDWWFGEGKEIRVERAPTHFGVMDLTIRGTAAGVQVQLDPPKRQPPKRIVLHLPKSRPLIGSLPGVEVVVRSDQKKRWDFPTVVKLYSKHAVALEQ